jgi:hypothetical protein
MGLYDNLSKMLLGLKGQKPNFEGESKTSTLHNKSSTINDPKFTGRYAKLNPSILDETDALNKNKFRSAKGQKYTDKLPK